MSSKIPFTRNEVRATFKHFRVSPSKTSYIHLLLCLLFLMWNMYGSARGDRSILLVQIVVRHILSFSGMMIKRKINFNVPLKMCSATKRSKCTKGSFKWNNFWYICVCYMQISYVSFLGNQLKHTFEA